MQANRLFGSMAAIALVCAAVGTTGADEMESRTFTRPEFEDYTASVEARVDTVMDSLSEAERTAAAPRRDRMIVALKRLQKFAGADRKTVRVENDSLDLVDLLEEPILLIEARASASSLVASLRSVPPAALYEGAMRLHSTVETIPDADYADMASMAIQTVSGEGVEVARDDADRMLQLEVSMMFAYFSATRRGDCHSARGFLRFHEAWTGLRDANPLHVFAVTEEAVVAVSEVVAECEG